MTPNPPPADADLMAKRPTPEIMAVALAMLRSHYVANGEKAPDELGAFDQQYVRDARVAVETINALRRTPSPVADEARRVVRLDAFHFAKLDGINEAALLTPRLIARYRNEASRANAALQQVQTVDGLERVREEE